MHHEPPRQQHGRDSENGQHRVNGHHYRDHDAQVDLREVRQQRLAVQQQAGQPCRGIGKLDRAHQQGIVSQPADELARGDRGGPGERVQASAYRAAGEGRGDRVERERGHAVGQANRPAGEHAAVNDPAVHAPLGQHEQRDGRHHGVERRQQDRYRQHPHGKEVAHHAALQVGHPRSRPDRDQAAAEEQQEGQEFAGVP